ncbi:MAG: EAL domain-containing protein, partial [Ruminococcaceae bacterium]|nr:EAL domain-containing protein [Oscillospiraceae bacterium]
YEKGNHWFSFDYKRKDRGGKIKWYSILAHLITDPLTNDLYAFVYTVGINEIKEYELALPQKVEHDSNAMVYTKESVKIFVSNMVDSEKDRNRLCAFLLIDINGINKVKENVGINVASRIISLIGRLFKLLFDNTGVVGRVRDDRFAIFLPLVLSASDAEIRSKEIINTIQACVVGADIKESIDFSVGISVLNYNDATFSTLYDSADSALERNKRQIQGNQFALFDAQKEYSDEASFLILSEGRFIEKEFTVNSKRHDETMLTSFFNCTAYLANAADTESAMKSVLEETAKYYKCDRIYVLDLSKDNKTVNGLHEWRKRMYRPTLDLTKNVPIGKLPAVKKAYDSLHTIILQSVSREEETTTSEKTFIASPVLKNSKVVGFICIDNPTKHADDIALIYSLSSLLSVLKNLKSSSNETLQFDFDPQTKLLNRTRYWRDVTSVIPDTLSSLGVAFADVNGLNVLNKLHGTEFGDGIIMFVSNELRQVFGENNVYRISGDEFVALSKNITNEEFRKLTEKFRTSLEFTHPGIISIGSTWSDSDINAMKMVDHAESLMHLEKQEHYRREENAGSRERPKILRSLQQSINDGMYRVYLQPKADIATGKIVGAEALVRLFDQNQGIVSPDKFIPLFEREQVIKHIDFFVLDRTLKILDTWKKAGKRLLPVSVNFSRDTLLDPSSLAFALDIFSHYDIPLGMIEIEITESIGNIERATVSNACEQFISQGFQLSLDDFGSEYSSLSVLSAIKFNSLKLDKSIISDIVTNKMSRFIVENTIRLCRETAMISVAEGVETEEQFNTLKELGCNIAQGYYFNKPIPPEDFEEKYIDY